VAEFRMPSLGADMEAGTLVEWMVKPGDQVKRGDIVAVVETQKGAIEIEIFETGVIEKILVDVGSKVPVGTPLARLRTKAEAEAGVKESAAPEAPPMMQPPAAKPAEAPSIAAALPEVSSLAAIGRVRASPAARQLALAHGLDLAMVTGSGAGGAIVLKDVEARLAAGPSAAPKKPVIGLDLAAMRAAIAAAMARSKREIPHYYLEHQVDVTGCEVWLAEKNAARPPESRLLLGALAAKAVASALRRFPAFNGFWQNGKFEAASAIHVGMAIAIRGGGLAAPAIHDADRLTCDELMAAMRDLVQRMRSGRIRSSEIADATITVSSLGERGVEALFGIIYPPQVAIVGFGKAVTRPWVVEGIIQPRSILTVTLSGDHRVSDGHAGALFLVEIDRLLQEPEKL
jgi:pyruvate dehydrogenase E2 component (dihydrolipoamide acetyltransferase)